MKAILRHKPLLYLFHFCLRSWMKVKFRARLEKIRPGTTPCIVLCNHTSNYDPILLGTQFPELLYFVASDHLFRLGFASRLLIALAAPIPRLKSATDVQTAKQILSKLREGGSVGLFAEGNNTFSGVTGEIPESTGKLVKRSGVSLITYRIDGAYFSNPRWGKHCRKGKVTGRVVAEYTPDQLALMSVEEVNQRIRQDLFVDAFEEQNRARQAYLGTDPAEFLELALYLCPRCGKIDSFKSSGDRLSCQCGLKLRYGMDGFFQPADDVTADGGAAGGAVPFETVRDWFFWQRQELSNQFRTWMEGESEFPLFSDEGQSLFQIDKANSVRKFGTGTLQFQRDGLALHLEDAGGGRQLVSFPWAQIKDVSIYEKMVLIFTTSAHETYEVKSEHLRNAVKYVDAYRAYADAEAMLHF